MAFHLFRCIPHLPPPVRLLPSTFRSPHPFFSPWRAKTLAKPSPSKPFSLSPSLEFKPRIPPSRNPFILSQPSPNPHHDPFLHPLIMLAFALVFCHSISLKSLQSAIGNPQLMQPIGSKYHRVALNGEELAVAIKIIELRPSDVSQPVRSRAHKRRVQHELELLARLKHRNVMSLRAYVCDIERLLLVYDYIAGGSLEDAMVRVRVREQQLALGWDARHQIAVGIAKGLRYLHFECSRRILHCSLTP